MKTLEQLVLAPYEFERNKHDLCDGFIENCINTMTRMEFLEELSNALELWAKARISNQSGVSNGHESTHLLAGRNREEVQP